jgi:hypothetical protein
MPTTINWTSDIIKTLTPNEVFVFGSNLQGFHGAGSAGYACRGDHRNNWRDDKWFLEAMKAGDNLDKIKGKWAIYGRAKGIQFGREGASWAIPTVTRPGAKRSITRRDIYTSLIELWNHIKIQTHITFYISPLGEGYGGYTTEEMMEVWNFLIEKHGLPENVKFIGRTKGKGVT